MFPGNSDLSQPHLAVTRRVSAKSATRLLFVVFLTAAILLVGSTVFVYRVGLIRVNAQTKMTSQLVVLRQLDEFLSALKDTETGQRGYLLTGNEQYLQPYTNVRQVVSTKLDGLQLLGLSGELPKDRVERIATLTEQKMSELNQTIELRREKGLEAATAIVRADRGRLLMDDIRAEIGQLRSEEERELAIAVQRADRATRIRTATFIGSCLLNLMFLGWAFRRLSREVRAREAAGLQTEQQKELLATTLASIGDAVIATDSNGSVLFLNPEAERLTGWKSPEGTGRPLPEIFRIINEQTRLAVENPSEKVLRSGKVVGLANHTLLIAKDGREIPIDDSAAPIRHSDGPLVGVVLVFRDFTERRNKEKQLTEQARLLDLSPNTILVRDLQDRITYWNKGAERCYGYSREEALGHTSHGLLKTEFPEPLEQIQEQLQQNNHWSGELIHTRKDGSKLTELSRWALDRDEQGRPSSVLETNDDITDQKRAEAALRESEALLRHFADTAPAILWVTEPDGAASFLSRGWYEFTGQTEAIALGNGWLQAVHPEDRGFSGETFRSANARREPFSLEFRLRRRDGEYRWAIDAGRPRFSSSGKFLGFIGSVIDIHERKTAEDASRDSKARFDLVKDATEVGFWFCDLPFDKLIWDNKVKEHFWLAPEAEVTIGTFYEQLHPDDRDRTRQAIEHSIAAKTRYDIEYRTVAPDGRQKWIRAIGRTFFDGNDRPIRFDGVTFDVTARKETDDMLRRANARLADQASELERLVAERTARLQEMVAELQHVSYAMAHDMRAPLRAMHTFATLLSQSSAGGVTPAQTQDYSRRIIVAAGRLDRLIQDALHYTKWAQQDFPFGPVNLSELVRDLIDTYPNFHAEKATILIDGELPVVHGNDSLLTQCFSNLLGNAVKFVAPGVRPEIHVLSEARDGVARIWVRDNGIGIPENSQAKLFGMFQKLDTQYEGTGIGLAIVRKVVERMGGKVGVESKPGNGSRFWVELPLANGG